MRSLVDHSRAGTAVFCYCFLRSAVCRVCCLAGTAAGASTVISSVADTGLEAEEAREERRRTRMAAAGRNDDEGDEKLFDVDDSSHPFQRRRPSVASVGSRSSRRGSKVASARCVP